MRSNLILATVGDESVHRTWLAGGERAFDLGLIYFGDQPDRFAEDADYYFVRKGIKYSLLHEAARALGPALRHYDFVWMPDDDVAADARCINRLFQTAGEYRLAVCQPAVGQGDVSFKTLRAQPGYLLRYSRFVEIMCPVFSREALARVLPTFTFNVSAWGLDWLWASMFSEAEMAVIDAAPVHHTRPLSSGGVHGRLAAMGVDPFEELQRLTQQHGLNDLRFQRATCRGTARLRGIRLDGERVWTRSWLSSMLGRRAA
ncbi:MAG TPA: hypothetical protein VF175_08545 [Lacipirellula sp.]